MLGVLVLHTVVEPTEDQSEVGVKMDYRRTIGHDARWEESHCPLNLDRLKRPADLQNGLDEGLSSVARVPCCSHLRTWGYCPGPATIQHLS